MSWEDSLKKSVDELSEAYDKRYASAWENFKRNQKKRSKKAPQRGKAKKGKSKQKRPKCKKFPNKRLFQTKESAINAAKIQTEKSGQQIYAYHCKGEDVRHSHWHLTRQKYKPKYMRGKK